MASIYEVPSWAGKPIAGLHLDVLKGDKLIQKLMVDEKKCYLFGRNQQLNDFSIDHASCSRVHAALVYHKHLNRAFLVDLGSTHGTYIGNMRLEANKPTQLPINSTFHFGASTRYYIIREKPQTGTKIIIDEIEKSTEDQDATGLLGLPDSEIELDNLTEFNTAHNRRISMLGITDDDNLKSAKKRKKKGISFNDDEEIINPEDVDPTIGRFRNLIQTTIVPNKRMRLEGGLLSLQEKTNNYARNIQPISNDRVLYDDISAEECMISDTQNNALLFTKFSSNSRLGISAPNPAPDVEIGSAQAIPEPSYAAEMVDPMEIGSMEPKKKKYAKEAWPGKKLMPTLLV